MPPESLMIRHSRSRGLRRWLPGITLLANYSSATFSRDLMAGVVLASLLAPVGMGYAEAAGLPAIYGLYATIIPLLVYAIFGPSRILILGPDSALTALIAATVIPLSMGDPVKAASLAAALAIMSGAICMLAGFARLGFVTDLLSKPIRYGYMNGIALSLLVGQLPKLLGFKVHGNNIVQTSAATLCGILEGKTNPATCLIGFSCLILILAARRWLPRVPAVFLTVVGSSAFVAASGLGSAGAITVAGALPQGLPVITLPAVSGTELTMLLNASLAIALVSIADMSVLSRIYALRGGYYVDENQELVVLGIANVAAGFSQGFSVSSSASRTPVAESAGAQTQMTGVVGALCIGILLLFAPKLMMSLPVAALGAVVIAASISIVEITEVRRLFTLRRGEFYLSFVCFFGVALIGVVQGIFLAVGCSLLIFIWRAWRPYYAVLGRVDGVKGYHDVSRHPEARRIPGLVIFRWDAPLFFANAEIFRTKVLKAAATAPTATRCIAVAAEPVTDIDITAADILAELQAELHESGIELWFAEIKGPVKDRLKRYGLFEKIGEENILPTVGQMVDHYVDKYQVEWRDWEEQ